MGQHVVRIEFGDSLCHGDGFVQAVQILQGTRHAVHGFGKDRIGRQGLLVFGQGALLLALGHQVEGGVVVVFGLLAGVSSAMKRNPNRSRTVIRFNRQSSADP